MALTVPLKMFRPPKLRIESSHRLHDATSVDGPRSLLNFENRPLPAGWYRIRLETLSLPRVCTVNLLPDFGDGLVEAPLVNVILQSEVCESVLVRFPSSVMQIAYAAPTLFFEVRHVDLESLTFFRSFTCALSEVLGGTSYCNQSRAPRCSRLNAPDKHFCEISLCDVANFWMAQADWLQDRLWHLPCGPQFAEVVRPRAHTLLRKNRDANFS